ncbi:MAG: hypothetical protein OET90_09935, partial [Desulfuromonadales bacterium]|nr:hypothetical protein [Desulfuromonadales bacterium]
LVEKLKSWQDPQTKEPVFRNVYRRNQIFSGPYLEKAPDILLDANFIEGNNYLSRQSRTRSPGVCLDNLTEEEMASALFLTKSGSHREDGVFVGYGDPFKSSDRRLKRAGIIDLAPTIFSLMGLPLPQDWEGQSLLPQGSESEKVAVELDSPQQKKEYSEEQAALVRQRLRDLGYME